VNSALLRLFWIALDDSAHIDLVLNHGFKFIGVLVSSLPRYELQSGTTAKPHEPFTRTRASIAAFQANKSFARAIVRNHSNTDAMLSELFCSSPETPPWQFNIGDSSVNRFWDLFTAAKPFCVKSFDFSPSSAVSRANSRQCVDWHVHFHDQHLQ